LSKSRQFVRDCTVCRLYPPNRLSGMEIAHGEGMKNPIRVVFVEDDPEMLAVYAENFENPEFQIVAARDGKEAIDLLRNSEDQFDVVVTDNFMPKMDGMRLLKIVRYEFPQTKLLMVTGYGNWTDYLDAEKIGVYKFVDKPVKMRELKDLIRAIA
jgi:DNA-binding NtrC family response regulator